MNIKNLFLIIAAIASMAFAQNSFAQYCSGTAEYGDFIRNLNCEDYQVPPPGNANSVGGIVVTPPSLPGGYPTGHVGNFYVWTPAIGSGGTSSQVILFISGTLECDPNCSDVTHIKGQEDITLAYFYSNSGGNVDPEVTNICASSPRLSLCSEHSLDDGDYGVLISNEEVLDFCDASIAVEAKRAIQACNDQL